jgi:hypothetical protein
MINGRLQALATFRSSLTCPVEGQESQEPLGFISVRGVFR